MSLNFSIQANAKKNCNFSDLDDILYSSPGLYDPPLDTPLHLCSKYPISEMCCHEKLRLLNSKYTLKRILEMFFY